MDMSNITDLRQLSTLALRQRKAYLLRSLKPPPGLLHASLLERYLKCGRPNCHCRRGDKHGPFFYLSRCLAQGQMQTLLLKTDGQIAQARHGVAAFRQVAQTLDQLSWLNWELLRRREPLQPQP